MGSAISGIASLAAGTGGAAPTVDMSKQIGNANATYATATSDAAQTMQQAQALNAQSQSTLANVNGSETPAMQAVNASANQNLSTYGNTFVPLQQQQAQQAANYTSDANTQQRAGAAVADQNSATQASLANQRAQLASEGVDPASVHAGGLEQQQQIAGAANAAGAANQSVLQTQATGSQLVNQANQLGLQVGSAGTNAAQAAAGIGSGIVANTNNTNNSNINNLTASNTYLTGATNANQSSANIANSQFQDQQQTYQDNAAAAASKGAAIGGIASSAAKAMMRGGPVPSTPKPARLPQNYMAGIPTLFHGGPITPRGAQAQPIVPGTTDTKLIAATPGEFMIPKDVTQHLGHEKLHKLIDKTREEIATRQGIPMHHQLSSAHTSMGA
jgi:hypothetical protein